MQLFDVPRRSIILVEASQGVKVKLFFHHIDGAYSYCIDENGAPVHLAAWSDVELVGPFEEAANA